MRRIAFARALCFAVAAGLSTLAAFAPPASAEVPCEKRVLDDWVADERIDGVYGLRCYEAAIDAIPLDLRDYTNAVEVISRALASAARRSGPADDLGASHATVDADPASAPGGVSSMPLALVVAGGLALALLAAGAVGHVARRRRTQADFGEG